MEIFKHIASTAIIAAVGLFNPCISLGDNSQTNPNGQTNRNSRQTNPTAGTSENPDSFKSPKRGVCWEEGKVNLNARHASMLTPGVSWAYNWGPTPAYPNIYSDQFYFVPMAWNAAYDASQIRSWLKDHPETRYLLGFNEPNFSDQAKMTPAQAAEAWPGPQVSRQTPRR